MGKTHELFGIQFLALQIFANLHVRVSRKDYVIQPEFHSDFCRATLSCDVS